MALQFNNFKHNKQVDYSSFFTHLARPIHRESGVNFEDQNGIATWADEIDYGLITDFGWAGSGHNVDGTYLSLLNAIHNSIEDLHNEILALKGGISINATEQFASNSNIWKLDINTGADASTTNWSIIKGTTSWLKNSLNNEVQPFSFSSSNTGPYTSTVMNSAATVYCGPTVVSTSTGDPYVSFNRTVSSINAVNGTSFNGDDNNKAFNVRITGAETQTYDCLVKAENNGKSVTHKLSRTITGNNPTSYIWRINSQRGSVNGNVATFKLDEENFIYITDYNTNSVKLRFECETDRTFSLNCVVTYEGGTTSTKTINCSVKGIGTETNYYWYVGQDHPSENSIIVTDTNSPGWRLTGTSLDADYSFSTTENNITDNPTRRESWYIALPVETQYHLYDDLDANSDGDFITDETVEFNGVTYKIYHLEVPSRALGGITIKKII